MKAIRITKKEVRRASGGLTVVVRRQPNGLCMVAIVLVASGLPIFKPVFVELPKVSQVVKDELRLVSKCFDCPMAHASRTR